jgi:hypothetical protein
MLKHIPWIFVGLVLTAAGVGFAIVGAVAAYEGYSSVFDIPLIGWLGPCVAAASAFGFSAALMLQRAKMHKLMATAVIGAVCAFVLDFAGNALALTHEIDIAKQAAADRNARVGTAGETLADKKDALKKLTDQKAVVNGADVCEAQRVLRAEGYYRLPNKIDCKEGGNTQTAIDAYNTVMNPKIAALETDIDAARKTKGEGAAVSDEPMALWQALLLAFGITAMAALLTSAGVGMLSGVPGPKPMEPEQAVAEARSKMAKVTQLFGGKAA